MNSPSHPPEIIGGYPYLPQALRAGAAGTAAADRFHVLLMDGGLAKVQAEVAAAPALLAELLPIVANPEASINVRLGASIVFERHAGAPALRALLPQLAALAAHADARVRADACYYLGLTGEARARDALGPRLHDADADVREIAVDALETLTAAGA